MKIKNIIILGGIVFAIYYLSKKKGKRFAQLKNEGAGGVLKDPDYVEGDKPMPDDGDKDLTDVSNGDEPTTLGGVKPPKPRKLSQEEVIALFKRANNYYRGGARPTQQMIDRINTDRKIALKEVEERGLMSAFKSWLSSQKFVDKFKYPPMTILQKPRPVGDVIQIRRDSMPIPQNTRIAIADKTVRDYRNRLGLTNMPPMAI